MNIHSTHQLAHQNRRRGTAIVEAALILPLLLTITFATIEYGWLLLCDQQLTNVCQEATRLAATPTSTNTAVNSEISTLMTSYNMGSTGYTTTFSPANVANVTTGNAVAVTISVPYSTLEITGVTLFPIPSTITSTTTMIKEGN